MEYNIDEDGKGICEYCGKKMVIFRDGYCKSCYKLMLKDTYILNPEAKFSKDSQEELVFDFLNNPHQSKEELAKKYGIAKRTVFHTLKKYTIKIKVLG